MGKTYKDSKGFNPSSKPKNKKSQKNIRHQSKEVYGDSQINKMKEEVEDISRKVLGDG